MVEIAYVIFGVSFAPCLSLCLRRVYLSHLCFRHFAVGINDDVVMRYIGPSGLDERGMEWRVVIEAAHFGVNTSVAAGLNAHLAHQYCRLIIADCRLRVDAEAALYDSAFSRSTPLYFGQAGAGGVEFDIDRALEERPCGICLKEVRHIIGRKVTK